MNTVSYTHLDVYKRQTSYPHGFWMKNTLLPLDMIWIDEDKKIVDIQTAIPVSYTHLDVYKRQVPTPCQVRFLIMLWL